MVWEYFGFAKGFISVWRTMYMCKKYVENVVKKEIRVQLNQSFRFVLLFHSSLMVGDWVKLYFMRFPLCKRYGLIFHPISFSFSFSLLLPLLLSHSPSAFLAFSPFGVPINVLNSIPQQSVRAWVCVTYAMHNICVVPSILYDLFHGSILRISKTNLNALAVNLNLIQYYF